jgi:hypothetical protein
VARGECGEIHDEEKIAEANKSDNQGIKDIELKVEYTLIGIIGI